jgi:hypothetical protein
MSTAFNIAESRVRHLLSYCRGGGYLKTTFLTSKKLINSQRNRFFGNTATLLSDWSKYTIILKKTTHVKISSSQYHKTTLIKKENRGANDPQELFQPYKGVYFEY